MKKKRNAKLDKQATDDMDGVFFLKLVMYLILGSQWLRFADDSGKLLFSIPIGLIFGVIFAMHDHFRIDRKIEFAVILIAAMIGFYAMVGITLRV